MWMNEWEIDNAVERWWDHPVLGPAVRTLNALRETTNANSDGWHIWPKPANAAGQLMCLIQDHEKWERTKDTQRPVLGIEATPERLRAALKPVKAFRTRMVRQMTERYDTAQGARWNFTITERMPTRREELSKEIMDCERTARDHATLADRYLAKAAELSRQLAELPEDDDCQSCGCVTS